MTRETATLYRRRKTAYALERKLLQKRILEISAKEQQRIGQDLHDGICQHLTAITLLIEILELKLADKSAPEAADAAEIAKLVTEAIVQTKSLAKGLLPVNWNAQGLVAALQEMAANMEKLPVVSCRVNVANRVLIRDAEVAVQLYRIAQEAVANALKHARASHIEIGLAQSDERITLTIADDGIGFKPNPHTKSSLGLSIMRSRAETIGATLRLRQAAGGGTVVECSRATPLRPSKPLRYTGQFNRRTYDPHDHA